MADPQSEQESARRAILEAVAGGSLSPAEAAERLAALDGVSGTRTAEEEDPAPVRRVRIVSTGHPVRVAGDPGRTGVSVEGPHDLRREGDTVVIQAEHDDRGDFFIASVPPWRHRAERVDRLWRTAPPLVVRVPPDVALDADVTATSLTVRDVRGPIGVTVAAGSAKIGGFAAPIDVDVSAGSLSASGVLDRGESRVRCSAGSVKLHLGRGSSVRVKGTANAGRLSMPFAHHVHAGGTSFGTAPGGSRRGPRGPFGPFGPFGEQHESVIGEGAGVLDVEVTTGSVVVRTDP